MSRFDINNFPNLYFNEIDCLSKFIGENNFIQTIISSFHDYDNLYFISKFYDGFIADYIGDKWNENQLKFFSACIIQSLTALRKKELIHRDLHFSNLVFDERQYINLIDFHITMQYRKKDEKKNNYLGAFRICPPEITKGLEYDYNSDYYRLGSMMYYILFKKYPNDIKKEPNMKDIQINFFDTKNYSISCIDFINKLIITEKEKRIGFHDIEELKSHKFFNDFNWEALAEKKLNSPFPKKQRENQGFCNVEYKFTKKVFLTSNLMKNDTFRNILFTYDIINSFEVYKILQFFGNNKNNYTFSTL